MNKRIINILFIALFAVLTINLNVVYATDQSDIIKTIEINNFKKYNDNYYRGAKPKTDDQYEDLKALGVKTIIDLRSRRGPLKQSKAAKMANKHGLKYVSIKLEPTNPPSKKAVKKFFEVVNDPDFQPVFVHCSYGQDRTGIMSALYRVNNDNWTFDEAYNEMLGMGYRKTLYWRLKRFLKKYCKEKEATQTNAETSPTDADDE